MPYFVILILFLSTATQAAVFVLPESGNLIGQNKEAYSIMGETIDEVGRRFNMGYYEMVRANPRIDAIHPLADKTRLIVPSQFILPDVSRKGIIINLAEYRLYYFPTDDNIVLTFPIGIGKEGWDTPLGMTKITAKVVNPAWHPTAKILAAAEQLGAPIPEAFPPGPHNPLGKHVLRLSWPNILIHGTNRMDGVGARVSAGCIRMLPQDIEYLFSLVPIGTPVRVINEPVKVGKQKGSVFVQIHPLLAEQKNIKLKVLAEKKLVKAGMANCLENKVIQQELEYPSGKVINIKT